MVNEVQGNGSCSKIAQGELQDELFHTLFLGALQGVTEFLPVSSSVISPWHKICSALMTLPCLRCFSPFCHHDVNLCIFLRDILELSKEWFLG